MKRSEICRVGPLMILAMGLSSCRSGRAPAAAAPPPPRPPAVGQNFDERVRALTAEAEAVSDRFIEAVAAGNGEQAYALTSPGLRKTSTRQTLDSLINAWLAEVGPVRSHQVVTREAGSEPRRGSAYVKLACETGGGRRRGLALLVLVRSDGDWKIENASLRVAPGR
jgi:hypothetical protein